jgi:uncharacterized membrane protein YsdA (DUF1294 family)
VSRHKPRGHAGAVSYVAIAAFLALYLAVGTVWPVAPWVAKAYLAASAVCFLAYALDKSAAVAGRWRTKENTLLFLGLLGGWPGAIVAQQVLHHKSSKASFQLAFWASVVLNVFAFVLLSSPFAPGLRV